MRPISTPKEFARQALASGNARGNVQAALEHAGWSTAEAMAAIDAWVEAPGLPPVPRPGNYVSARELFAYGLTFMALAMVSWHVVQLGFAVTDWLMPDILQHPRARGSVPKPHDIRWSVASVAAFLPLFVIMDTRVNRFAAGQGASQRRSAICLWYTAITLLIASAALLGDLAMSIYALLNGELTLNFACKALVVAIVAGLVFNYYRDWIDD